MALLPPIPSRPEGRPETWWEYQERRAILAMHRQFYDDLTSWLDRDNPIAWATRNQVVERFLASGARDLFFVELPKKRVLRQVWSCGRVPGHEHASNEEALRCQEAPTIHVDIQVNDGAAVEYVLKRNARAVSLALQRFVRPKLSEEEIRRIEGTI